MKRVAIVVSILFFSLAFVSISVAVAQSVGEGTAADTRPGTESDASSASSPATVAQASNAGFRGSGGGCTFEDWQSVTSVTTGRSRTGVVYLAATGMFYMAGGEATGGNRNIPIEEYDPVANTWTDRSNLLTGVSNTGAAAVGSYVYVPGGYNGTAGVTDMQRFDPVANTVITMTGMPGVNYAHAVTVLDDMIYVLGGSSTGVAGTTNYIYDVGADSWSTGAALPTAVQYPAAASDGTYVYVLGGNTTNIATVQRYDPVGNTWDTIASMNIGRGGPGAFFDGTNLWAVGGGWTTYLPSTEYWDGVAWQAGPDMTVGVRTVGAAFGDGMALKAAGWNGAYQAAAEILIFACAPVANADVYTTTEDITLDVAAPGVLGNDTPDTGVLTAVLEITPTYGTLALNADGSFTYTPTQDFYGMDSFTYYATDGITNSNSANVDIWVTAVNDAPVAVDDSYTTTEDIPLVITTTGVLGNDSDVDTDPLTATLDSDATNGSVVLNADGSFTYTPDLDYCGTDSFTYHANDGIVDSNIATATIEVECDTSDDVIYLYLPVVINN
jgi:VCBS repeat-containing protein